MPLERPLLSVLWYVCCESEAATDSSHFSKLPIPKVVPHALLRSSALAALMSPALYRVLDLSICESGHINKVGCIMVTGPVGPSTMLFCYSIGRYDLRGRKLGTCQAEPREEMGLFEMVNNRL